MSQIDARFRLTYPGFHLDVDLSLPGRGITALFGPSGSGKTTLLRCIAGLTRAPGELKVQGERWQDETCFLPVHRRPLGYVFQDANLFAHLSVRDNLEYGLRRASRDAGTSLLARTRAFLNHPAERLERLERIIGLLGIAPLLDRLPGRLSGGEQQRVGIARALAADPRLLLMDEPLAALDHARKQEVLPYLEALHDELEIPVLYVSHSPDEVARLADHLVVMEAGRVLASGPLGETLARIDLPIRLGEDAGVVLDARIAERDTRWHLARVEFSGGSLWVRDGGHALDHPVRVRILARDVSLTLTRHSGTSILNTLPAVVVEMAADSHPALALVRLRLGDAPLVARLTQRSAQALELTPGLLIYAQVKAVALVG